MVIATPDKARCAATLDQLMRSGADINASMLALRDGRPFVERCRTPMDSGRFAAMSSSLVALGQSVLRELGAAPLDHVVIEGTEGKLIIFSVPGSSGLLILAVFASRNARLGLVLSQSKTCAQAISTTFTVAGEDAA